MCVLKNGHYIFTHKEITKQKCLLFFIELLEMIPHEKQCWLNKIQRIIRLDMKLYDF